jgi:hypothetical protein
MNWLPRQAERSGRRSKSARACSNALGSARTDDERQQLSSGAHRAATAAISEEGLSPDQYAQILAAADEDAEMEEQLFAAAPEAE